MRVCETSSEMYKTVANRAISVAIAILLTLSAHIPVHANQNVYLSLYYADPATTKTITDRILLVDGRSLSIERGKLHPPEAFIRTEWNEFYEAMFHPPKSDIRLHFKTANGKTSVCLQSSCAIISIACPRIQQVKKPGAKCFTVPSLLDLEKVK